MSFADVEPTEVRRKRWTRPTDPIEFAPTPFPPGRVVMPPEHVGLVLFSRPPRWPALAVLAAVMALVAACVGFL